MSGAPVSPSLSTLDRTSRWLSAAPLLPCAISFVVWCRHRPLAATTLLPSTNRRLRDGDGCRHPPPPAGAIAVSPHAVLSPRGIRRGLIPPDNTQSCCR